MISAAIRRMISPEAIMKTLFTVCYDSLSSFRAYGPRTFGPSFGCSLRTSKLSTEKLSSSVRVSGVPYKCSVDSVFSLLNYPDISDPTLSDLTEARLVDLLVDLEFV